MKNRGAMDVIHFQQIAKKDGRPVGAAWQQHDPLFNQRTFARARNAAKPIQQVQPRAFSCLCINLSLQMLGELLG
jgi:hypothetical protein